MKRDLTWPFSAIVCDQTRIYSLTTIYSNLADRGFVFGSGYQKVPPVKSNASAVSCIRSEKGSSYWLMLDVCSWCTLGFADAAWSSASDWSLWCGWLIYSTWQNLERCRPFILGVTNNRAFSCSVFKLICSLGFIIHGLGMLWIASSADCVCMRM